MTTTATAPTATDRPSPTRRRLVRAGAVAGATVANTVLFLATHAAGTEYTIEDSKGVAQPFHAVDIAVVTLVFGLLGWATLALLERFTSQGARWWTWLAIAVTLLSMVPIVLAEMTVGTQIMLAVIHAVIPAVLIPAFRHRG